MCREFSHDVRKFADAQHLASWAHLQRFVVEMHPTLGMCFSPRRHRTRLRFLLKLSVMAFHFGITYAVSWALLAFPCQRMGWCLELCPQLLPLSDDAPRGFEPCAVNSSVAIQGWKMYYLPPVPPARRASAPKRYEMCIGSFAVFDPQAPPRDACTKFCRQEPAPSAKAAALDLRSRCDDVALAGSAERQAETTGLFCFAQAQWPKCEATGVLPLDWIVQVSTTSVSLSVIMPLDMFARWLLQLKDHVEDRARNKACKVSLTLFGLILLGSGLTVPIAIAVDVSHRFYHQLLVSFVLSWAMWQCVALPQYALVFYLRPLLLALQWHVVFPIAACLAAPLRLLERHLHAKRARDAELASSVPPHARLTESS